MSRALIYGLAILVAANALWFVALELELYWPLIIWSAPFVAAALVSYVAPKRKLLLGASMTIPAVLLPLAFNGLYQLCAKPVDFAGLDGAMSLATMITPFTLLLCAGGALIGWMVSSRLHKTSRPST
jgi:hypothetical protein